MNDVRHLEDGTTVIILKRRDGSVLECFIDTAHYPVVKSYQWHAVKTTGSRTFYAAAKSDWWPYEIIYMHKFITNHTNEVDHRDHNGLNNRSSNLRATTSQQNQANKRKRRNTTSKYIGVSWHRAKWLAAIRTNGKSKHLGMFTSEEDAARCYDAAVKERGEFAVLNFPESKE